MRCKVVCAHRQAKPTAPHITIASNNRVVLPCHARVSCRQQPLPTPHASTTTITWQHSAIQYAFTTGQKDRVHRMVAPCTKPCTSKPCGKFMLLHNVHTAGLQHGFHSTSIKHTSVQQSPCVLTTSPLTHPTCAHPLNIHTLVSCMAAKARVGDVLMQ